MSPGQGFDFRLRRFRHYQRDVFLDNPKFFPRDGNQVGSKVLPVVHVDGADRGDLGNEDIGRVQPSPHAGFKHAPVHFFALEKLE